MKKSPTIFPLPSGMNSHGCGSASSTAYAASGGSGTLNVAVGRECSWSASSEAAWIAIGSTREGQGDGTVAYTVEKNDVPVTRRGSVVVSGARVELSQAAGACRYQISSAPDPVDAATASCASRSARTRRRRERLTSPSRISGSRSPNSRRPPRQRPRRSPHPRRQHRRRRRHLRRRRHRHLRQCRLQRRLFRRRPRPRRRPPRRRPHRHPRRFRQPRRRASVFGWKAVSMR